MELLKPRPALLALGLWACADAPPESPSAILARVGEVEISARDFATALERIPAGSEAQPLADWRRQLQALIDKELLLLEARAQGLDEAVASAIDGLGAQGTGRGIARARDGRAVGAYRN